MVKFTKDGSSANTAALKLARAHTGRDLVAICAEQPFFSYDDWFIGTTTMDGGIPHSVGPLTVQFRYNDLASLRALFEAHPGRIAAVMLEAARAEEPAPGFLHGLQALCREQGAVFILDEMITGFRWHLGGAQAAYDVTPDLSTFGKALANGFALSALCGTREIMRRGAHDRDEGASSCSPPPTARSPPPWPPPSRRSRSTEPSRSWSTSTGKAPRSRRASASEPGATAWRPRSR